MRSRIESSWNRALFAFGHLQISRQFVSAYFCADHPATAIIVDSEKATKVRSRSMIGAIVIGARHTSNTVDDHQLR